MITGKLKADLKVAWWLFPCIRCLAMFYSVTGIRPGVDKLNAVIAKAMTVTIKAVP